MRGRTVFIVFAIFLVIFAVGLFYALNYAHYDESEFGNHEIAGLSVENYRQIDGETSPIKFRACFHVDPADVADALSPTNAGEATPLVAPFWFDCFDAKTLTNDLENGKVKAYRYSENEPYGTTSYIVTDPEGNAVAWRQLNECGDATFSGETPPPQCPITENENG